MNRTFAILLLVIAGWETNFTWAAEPLRIFLRAGPKTHGPGDHDGPSWLRDWKPLLTQRGAVVDGKIGFPNAEELGKTDVLVLYAAEGGTIQGDDRADFEKFLKRGGGIVVIHDSICGTDPQWFKTVVGGAWEHGHSKWFEGDVSIYYQDSEHPITQGASNFDFDDEMYYDLHMMPEARVLAATYAPDKRNTRGGRSYPSVYGIVPQMWTYERTWDGAAESYRAFVAIPGHKYASFSLPHFRAVLLRGIAWTGKRDIDSLCTKEELASLRYPEGGPTAPEKAAEKIITPPDFTINLVASEPLINKVMSLDWDPAGRLWVVETPDYPAYTATNRPPRGRVSRLESASPGGRMDKKSIFADGLILPTSFVFHRDGVIVCAAPDIYWLRDTDGDGKADKKVLLYTGFGTGDTHAVISNMRWGMDGWVYATVGYSRGDIYSADRAKHFGRITEGVLRFKPDGSALEQVSSKGSNTWGMDFAPDGEIFFTQATSGDHLNHVVMPENALVRGKVGSTASYKPIMDHRKSFPALTWQKQAYVQIDLVGGFTAEAGSCVYNGGAWPDQYNNRHYSSEPTINIVHEDVLKPEGVSFVASRDPDRTETEFLTSRDLWFRPIHTRIGPDGALYVVDWYNQAAVHNDTRGTRHGPNNAAVRPDRDHYFARIWRVQHKQAKNLSIPRLDQLQTDQLIASLAHPNGFVRDTAARLVRERGIGDTLVPLIAITKAANMGPYAQIAALHTLNALAKLDSETLESALGDKSAAVRKNALLILAQNNFAGASAASVEASPSPAEDRIQKAVMAQLNDSDPRLRLEALIALGSLPVSTEIVEAIVAAWPELNDKHLQSAAVAAATKDPARYLDTAFRSKAPTRLADFMPFLARDIANRQDPALLGSIVISLAKQPANTDALKEITLNNLVAAVKADVAPDWGTNLQAAFKSLTGSSHTGVVAASLPLIARWDKTGALASETTPLIQKLIARLNDASEPDDQRAQLVSSLVSVRQLNADILPSVAKLLGSPASPALQRRVIEALGSTADTAAGAIFIGAFMALSPELQDAAFAQISKRADWSLAFVEALKNGTVKLASLNPIEVGRLRTHSDKAVAERARSVIDELRGPELKEKNQVIAKFTPLVSGPGNVEAGHNLFTQNCAVCHRFKDEGKDLAPDLTGMGAHGPEELLVHILDPNRYVEANYVSWSFDTRDDESFDGLIARENRSGVVLRNASGDVEIKAENIRSRRNTGRSVMPEGFEALGSDGLRDILAYVCADELRFRILDLRPAFTANSTRGIYRSLESANESLQFKKFGVVKIGGVPFEILSPAKTDSGNNLIVLKGGEALARSMPQKVEIPGVNVKASKLHFLGGVGGWAWPWGGDANKGLPVARVTVGFTDGQSEEIILKNGVEIADYNGEADVPESKAAPDLLKQGQVRWFTKLLSHAGVIQKIALESFHNAVAPTFVAITAELDDQSGRVTAQASSRVVVEPPAAFKWGTGAKTLIVGGGSSHDFEKWFHQADAATLSSGNLASVNYTEHIDAILPALKDLDVLYLSNNQPMKNPALRRAILDFADAGKGLLLVHPALWYNWNDWPEYNRVLGGGGSRSHDKYGEFEVKLTDARHPVTAGVPAVFKISDELYHFEPDPMGTPIQVLATAYEAKSGKTYPMVWIVKHPKARIVCIAPGHDGKAHEHPAFQALLQSSLKWVANQH